MKKISPRIIILSLLALGAIAAASLYFYLFSSLSHMGVDSEGPAAISESAFSIQKTAKENMNKLTPYFIKDGEEALFVSSLENQCGSFSLSCTIQSLNETLDETGTTKVLSVTLGADGSLGEVNKLIGGLESSSYPLIIGRAAITGNASSTWKGSFDLTVPVLVDR